MLEITVPETETFNEETSKLYRTPSATLRLEHSLSSLSKWERFWEIPFFSSEKKTAQQLVSYVGFMSDTPVDPNVLASMTDENFEQLNTYLQAKHSATWFSDERQRSTSRQTITAELIYYWMTAFNIPFECDQWPLNFLMNLIKICQLKSEPEKKKGAPTSQRLNDRAALNAKRREEMKTKG